MPACVTKLAAALHKVHEEPRALAACRGHLSITCLQTLLFIVHQHELPKVTFRLWGLIIVFAI